MAVNRALAELDFAPGELAEDQFEVKVVVSPEEGYMGVGATEAQVEVTLLDDDYLGPPAEPAEEVGDWDDEDEAEEGEYQQPEAGSARLREFLGEVLGHMGVQAKLTITETAELVSAELTGDDLGIVIGKRGQTIDALEYLASIVLYPEPGVRKRVEIDAEGYKGRRRATIERIANRRAQEAVRRGKPVQLEPMTPAERKIVHITLKERRDVVTESTGREPNRSVIISPVRQ
jgi:spoIIIJ-associated protein